jgi:cell wall-active antibiotic response 4TMS protein YvqF
MHDSLQHRDFDEPPRETISAWFSATARRGEWLPAEDIRVLAMFGNVTLDFRRALLEPGITTLECVAFCGSIDIIVPSKLDVELAASAVLGAVEQRNATGNVRSFIAAQIRRAIQPEGRPPRDEPEHDESSLLRVIGRAVCGAITVKVR